MKSNHLLPYDKTNPVIYDNDSHEDTYTDEYLLALASSRDIDLRGIITTISFADAWQEPRIQYESLVNGRKELVAKAKRSGMVNIPDPVDGPSVSLQRPVSGIIEDTVPINSPAGRLIVEEAKKTNPEKPLVIIMGGQSTAVADAFLLDPSIADRVVIGWLVGMKENDLHDYNGWVDPWGTYILISRFKTIVFGPVGMQTAHVPKRRLVELPETELRNFMVEKELPHVNLPAEHDFDAQPAIPLMRPDYVKRIVKKSFCDFDKDGVPTLKDDENGNVWVVVEADKGIATEEWWRALKDPRAYGKGPAAPCNIPYNRSPFTIPGVIPAEQFDFGGEGISYHCGHRKTGSQVLPTAFRMTDRATFYKLGDRYCTESLHTGEWLEYTVDVKHTGVYDIMFKVSAARCGGIFHLEVDGEDRSGMISVPSTKGWDQWISLTSGGIALNAGKNVLRVCFDGGEFRLDSLEIREGNV
jgi:hypothetical protein